MTLNEKKATAATWFRGLRDQICTEFEAIEAEYAAKTGEATNQGFTRTPWSRENGGSGEMTLKKDRVVEKEGGNKSTGRGGFTEQFRHEIPGAAENPTFWASGISLVAHMASPLVPAAHFNTRMICVGDQPTRLWFGGGGDLTPMFENEHDTRDFHAAFQKVCDELDRVTHASGTSEPSASEAARSVGQQTNAEQAKKFEGFYPAFTAWCKEYFWLPHRNEERGVGGIFYDYLGLNTFGADTSPVTSGRFGKGGVTAEKTFAGMQLAANANLSWEEGLAFTKNVGRAFATIYPELIRRHMFERWTDEQRHHQLVKRGRYAEYNLLYDRGTRFGLMTGGNTEAILMSLPPVAVWE